MDYQKIWRFIAGILANDAELANLEHLQIFFELLMGEPQLVIGHQQRLLVLEALDECHFPRKLPNLQLLIDYIKPMLHNWLSAEQIIGGEDGILAALQQSPNILAHRKIKSLLSPASISKDAIYYLNTAEARLELELISPDEAVKIILPLLRQDHSTTIKIKTIFLLNNILTTVKNSHSFLGKHHNIVNSLIARLGDSNKEIRLMAALVLNNITHLSAINVSALVLYRLFSNEITCSSELAFLLAQAADTNPASKDYFSDLLDEKSSDDNKLMAVKAISLPLQAIQYMNLFSQTMSQYIQTIHSTLLNIFHDTNNLELKTAIIGALHTLPFDQECMIFLLNIITNNSSGKEIKSLAIIALGNLDRFFTVNEKSYDSYEILKNIAESDDIALTYSAIFAIEFMSIKHPDLQGKTKKLLENLKNTVNKKRGNQGFTSMVTYIIESLDGIYFYQYKIHKMLFFIMDTQTEFFFFTSNVKTFSPFFLSFTLFMLGLATIEELLMSPELLKNYGLTSAYFTQIDLGDHLSIIHESFLKEPTNLFLSTSVENILHYFSNLTTCSLMDNIIGSRECIFNERSSLILKKMIEKINHEQGFLHIDNNDNIHLYSDNKYSTIQLSGEIKKLIAEIKKLVSYAEPPNPRNIVCVETKRQKSSQHQGLTYKLKEVSSFMKEIVDTAKYPIDHPYPGSVSLPIQESQTKQAIGWRAIHFACWYGDYTTAKFSISQGANTVDAAEDGWTPMHALVASPYSNFFIIKKIAELLIESAANFNLNEATQTGDLPLHLTIEMTHYADSKELATYRQDYIELIRYFLESGADKFKLNKQGETAIELAKRIPIKNIAVQVTIELQIQGHCLLPTKWPSAYTYAKLSEHVYRRLSMDDKEISIRENVWGVENIWKVIQVYDNPNTKYYAVLYANQETGHLVLAHRGTIFNAKDFLLAKGVMLANIEGIIMQRFTQQLADVRQSTLTSIQFARQHGYKLSTTGHSSGGWNAGLATLHAYRENYRLIHTVVFDSPGFEVMIKKIDNDPLITITPEQWRSLDITIYLGPPHIFNSIGRHKADVKIIRIYPELENRESHFPISIYNLVKLSKAINDISLFVSFFDPQTHDPNDMSFVKNWPLIDTTQRVNILAPYMPFIQQLAKPAITFLALYFGLQQYFNAWRRQSPIIIAASAIAIPYLIPALTNMINLSTPQFVLDLFVGKINTKQLINFYKLAGESYRLEPFDIHDRIVIDISRKTGYSITPYNASIVHLTREWRQFWKILDTVSQDKIEDSSGSKLFHGCHHTKDDNTFILTVSEDFPALIRAAIREFLDDPETRMDVLYQKLHKLKLALTKQFGYDVCQPLNYPEHQTLIFTTSEKTSTATKLTTAFDELIPLIKAFVLLPSVTLNIIQHNPLFQWSSRIVTVDLPAGLQHENFTAQSVAQYPLSIKPTDLPQSLPFTQGYWDAQPYPHPITAEPVFVYRVFNDQFQEVGTAHFYKHPLLCRSASSDRHNLIQLTGVLTAISAQVDLATATFEDVCEALPPTLLEELSSSAWQGAQHGLLTGISNVLHAALRKQNMSAVKAKLFSQGAYYSGLFGCRFMNHYDSTAVDPVHEVTNAAYHAAVDTVKIITLQYTLQGIRHLTQQASSLAKQHHWGLTHRMLDLVGNSIRYGLFGYDAYQQGITHTATSVVAGMVTEKVVETTLIKSMGLNSV